VTLLRAADVSLSFGSRTLFSNLELVIEAEERVGLVGVNGCGKSTLMKILAGVVKPDAALLQLQRGARVTYLPQEPSFPDGATIASELTVAQRPLKEALDEHERLSHALQDDKAMARLAELTERIEALGGWDTAHKARTLLDRLGVKDWDRPVAELSGGLRKRVAVARALLSRPDLLMLDEPTNHLDAETVEWLEDELDAMKGALLLVTHDRYFLDGLVDRIIELSPGGKTTSYPGNYEAYLTQKLKAQEDAAVAQHKREMWIAQEIAWMRKGPEARRTKSRSRMERARKLMQEKGIAQAKAPQLQLAPAPRLSQTVIEAKGIAKSYGARSVFRGVDLIVQPGERIGIVGPNGAGKTTLVRTLIGELQPDAGAVVLGPRTRVAYYDQQRTQLDDTLTVAEAAHHDEWVQLNEKKVRLSDYLDDLGFPVPMQRMKVSGLSGGERNRLLLAKLFLEGANVLVLDEPSNDLDLITLTVLERLLVEFAGVVLLVTHDRSMLDKVATTILAVDGDGRVVRYEGNWEMYRRLRASAPVASAKGEAPVKAAAPAAAAPKSKPEKLSYKDQRELDGMEAAIEAAEAKKSGLETRLQEVATNPTELTKVSSELERATAEVDRLYARWQELSR
jgi:ATP-binding cassette subfamily F protein uup